MVYFCLQVTVHPPFSFLPAKKFQTDLNVIELEAEVAWDQSSQGARYGARGGSYFTGYQLSFSFLADFKVQPHSWAIA